MAIKPDVLEANSESAWKKSRKVYMHEKIESKNVLPSPFFFFLMSQIKGFFFFSMNWSWLEFVVYSVPEMLFIVLQSRI